MKPMIVLSMTVAVTVAQHVGHAVSYGVAPGVTGDEELVRFERRRNVFQDLLDLRTCTNTNVYDHASNFLQTTVERIRGIHTTNCDQLKALILPQLQSCLLESTGETHTVYAGVTADIGFIFSVAAAHGVYVDTNGIAGCFTTTCFGLGLTASVGAGGVAGLLLGDADNDFPGVGYGGEVGGDFGQGYDVAGGATHPGGVPYVEISAGVGIGFSLAGVRCSTSVHGRGQASEVETLELVEIKPRDGLCLDANNEDEVHMWPCDRSNRNQQWIFAPEDREIKSVHDGLCLAAPQRSTRDTQLYALPCNGAADQQWSYDESNGRIQNVHGICLDASRRHERGGRVHMWGCEDGNENQIWQVNRHIEPATPLCRFCSHHVPTCYAGCQRCQVVDRTCNSCSRAVCLDNLHDVHVIIGPADGESHKTVETDFDALFCPPRVDKNNWVNPDQASDTFDISVMGDMVTATRTDSQNAWAINLTIKCYLAGVIPVRVGSNSNGFVKTIHTEEPEVFCPERVNRENWLNADDAPDVFAIAVDGNRVTATRTDSEHAWAIDLTIECIGLTQCEQCPATAPTCDASCGNCQVVERTCQLCARAVCLDGAHDVIVNIGQGDGDTQKTVQTEHEGLFCPMQVDRYNWVNADQAPDMFIISVDGGAVTATRTDSANSWGLHLMIRCYLTEPVLVNVGSNLDGGFERTVETEEAEVFCPEQVNRHNWLNGDSAPDMFSIFVDEGNRVTAVRTDRREPWAIDLTMECSALILDEVQPQCVFCSGAIPSCDAGCGQCRILGQTCNSCARAVCLDDARDVIVNIGPGEGGMDIEKTVETQYDALYCPTRVDRNNWVNADQFGDMFDISVDGGAVTATRTDSPNSWGLHLRIRCHLAERIRVRVGPNTEGGFVQTVNTQESEVFCPERVDRNNWLTSDKFQDVFVISVNGNRVTATRTDSQNPWGVDLTFECIALVTSACGVGEIPLSKTKGCQLNGYTCVTGFDGPACCDGRQPETRQCIPCDETGLAKASNEVYTRHGRCDSEADRRRLEEHSNSLVAPARTN